MGNILSRAVGGFCRALELLVAVAGGGGRGGVSSRSSSPFVDLLEKMPDFFEKEVLRRLGPRDMASLAGAGRGCAAAVAATALMQWAKDENAIPSATWRPQLRVGVACQRAAEGGHLEVLKWLHSTGYPWDSTTCSKAAYCGRLEVLRWLREHGCPWDEATCAIAALGGHLTVLQWAREHHCPWNSSTSDNAASGGHLAVLQWAREDGCPWDEATTCALAAASGRLAVLRWAREHGCQWDVTTCYCAAQCGHLAVLRWAWEHDCPWHEDYIRELAVQGRHVEMLRWLDGLTDP
jgi:hypothetical protein